MAFWHSATAAGTNVPQSEGKGEAATIPIQSGSRAGDDFPLFPRPKITRLQ